MTIYPLFNTLGRDSLDRGGSGTTRRQLLRWQKKPSVYSAFNVRAINKTSRHQELPTFAHNQKANVDNFSSEIKSVVENVP